MRIYLRAALVSVCALMFGSSAAQAATTTTNVSLSNGGKTISIVGPSGVSNDLFDYKWEKLNAVMDIWGASGNRLSATSPCYTFRVNAATCKSAITAISITGKAGNDNIFPRASVKVTGTMGAGDDVLYDFYGTVSNTTLLMGDGNDRSMSGRGADWIIGGNGNDQFTDWAGADVFMGDAGNDWFSTKDGHVDQIICGGGYDEVHLRDKADYVTSDCEKVDNPR